MNVKLLQRVKNAILTEPPRFRMDDWYTFSDGIAPCGTTGCIAGFALVCNNSAKENFSPDEWKVYAKDSFGAGSVEENATLALEITNHQADRLFFASSWPQNFRTAYCDAGTRMEKAKIAAARIDHFIETGL